MSHTEEHASVVTPNNTTGASEMSAVIPESQQTTTPTTALTSETAATTTAQPSDAAPAQRKPSEPVAETVPPIRQLWTLAKAHTHDEIWGVTLADPDTHVPSQIVLQKYLNANDGDLTKAKDQLSKTLDWRAKMKPLQLLDRSYPRSKFGGLGYVTVYKAEGDTNADPETKEVFTWNIYGGVTSMEDTFGNLDEFIAWRACLMEQALQSLSISSATKPITAEYDPYKIYQVHDYKGVSFLRQPSSVKAASQETIKVFAQNYPELLKTKYFLNVPAVLGWVYGLMKMFVAAKTSQKFHPIAAGSQLTFQFVHTKVPGMDEMLPKKYGGKGADLAEVGEQPKLTD